MCYTWITQEKRKFVIETLIKKLALISQKIRLLTLSKKMEQAYASENYAECKGYANSILVHLPQNINALRGYALSCFMLEEYEESLATLLKALELSSEREFEYTYIGWCFCNMDNHIKACEAFERAVEINPLYEPALSGRTTAYVHLHSDRLEKVEQLEKTLDV